MFYLFLFCTYMKLKWHVAWFTEWTSTTFPSVYSSSLGSTFAVIDIPLNAVLSFCFPNRREKERTNWKNKKIKQIQNKKKEDKIKKKKIQPKQINSSFIISTFVQSCSSTYSINWCKCAISILTEETKTHIHKRTRVCHFKRKKTSNYTWTQIDYLFSLLS